MTTQSHTYKHDEVLQVACSRTGVAKFCSSADVQQVQLRSQAAGPRGTNKFEGDVVQMCQECRRSNRGCFKMTKGSK